MKGKKLLALTMVLLIVNSACSLPFVLQNREEFIANAAEATVQAYLEQKAPTAMLPVLAETEIPQPTATQEAPTPQPAAASPACYSALLTGETVPDGTSIPAGSAFLKRWTLRNTGSCTWRADQRLVFSSGDHMGGPASVKLNEAVKPGGQVNVTVDLKAPSKDGTYTGNWRMQTVDGVRFARIWVKIRVGTSSGINPTLVVNPTSTVPLTITNVVLSGSATNPSLPCPASFTSRAAITASAAGTITYFWELGDGSESSNATLSFDRAGTKTVQHTWTISGSDYIEYSLYIIDPLPGNVYGPSEFFVECEEE